MDKNSYTDAEQQLLNFLRENFPGRDDVVHLTNTISFIDADGEPYEVTGIELPTDDTETYSVQMQDARNREFGDYDYMELHSFGNFEKLLAALQSTHEHKLSTSEMHVIEGHFARLRGALASIDVTNNLLAHELKGIVIDGNVHNFDHIRDYSRRLLSDINKEGKKPLRQQWNDLENLSGGSLRQAVYAMAYSMSDAQIRSITFDKNDDKDKPYHITVGEDNRPGGVEGEYHLQFKPDIMNVTFGEQEEIAKEFGGTMRVTDGQEWGDFYDKADAIKFAEKIVDMNMKRTKDSLGLKTINDKLRNLLPDYGDHIFINEDLTIQRPDRTVRIVNVTHSLLVDSNEDIFVCGTTNGGFRLESLTSDELQKLNNILNEKKYNNFLSSNKEKDLVERYQSAGMGNGTQFWPDRGTLGIYQAFAFKNNNILVFKDADDSEGIRLSSLPHEERSRVMDAIGTLLDRHLIKNELATAKTQLVKVLDSAIVDIGDTILIKPTTVKVSGIKTPAKAVFFAPDGKGSGEFRLAGEGYSVLAIGKDGHTEYDVSKILDDVSSVNGLMKAVHDVHVAHLEGLAKHAIHDRITNAWQRFFTPDQLKILNRYHQVSASDNTAREVFSHLLDEVKQEPDVIRKPEKWITDTAKELNGIAEGIIREETRGLHI